MGGIWYLEMCIWYLGVCICNLVVCIFSFFCIRGCVFRIRWCVICVSPKGLQLEVRARRAPRLLVIFIIIYDRIIINSERITSN